MKVDRKELLKVLSLVKPGVALKEMIEQSGSFVFTGGRVITYNDEISVSAPVKFGIEGAVSAAELFGLLNKAKEDELDFEQLDDGLVEVTGKKFQATIAFKKDIVLPIDTINLPEEGWGGLPKEFSAALKFCLFSVGKDMTQPALTCVHASDDIIETCDRFRITRRFFDKSYFETGVLIPGGAAKELSAYTPVEFAASNGWLHFATEDDTVFSCRTFERLDYPNLDKFLEVEGGTLKFPDNMKKILDRASVFSVKGQQSSQPLVKITLADGNINVSSEGAGGRFNEECEASYDGDPCHFLLSPVFLSSILDIKTEAVLSGSQLMFEDDNFIHTVSLIAGK